VAFFGHPVVSLFMLALCFYEPRDYWLLGHQRMRISSTPPTDASWLHGIERIHSLSNVRSFGEWWRIV